MGNDFVWFLGGLNCLWDLGLCTGMGFCVKAYRLNFFFFYQIWMDMAPLRSLRKYLPGQA